MHCARVSSLVALAATLAFAPVLALASCARHDDGASAQAATPASIPSTNPAPAPLGVTNKMPDDDSEPGPMDREDLRHAIRAQLAAVRDEMDTLSAHAAGASDAVGSQLGRAASQLERDRQVLSRAADGIDQVSDADWPRFEAATRRVIDDAARVIAQVHQQRL